MKRIKILLAVQPLLTCCWGQDIDYPNVIYIFPDQFRNSALGVWQEQPYCDSIAFRGDPVITPNLNRLARESVVLTSAYSNCPLSSPYRGMLMTGMFPENSGVSLNCNSNRPVSTLRTDAICISDVMKAAGYSCGYIGKFHAECPEMNDPKNPGNYVEEQRPAWDAYTPTERRHGFDYWYSYGTYDVHKHPHYWDTQGQRHDINQWSPDHETDMAIAYLQNRDKQRKPDAPFFLMIGYNPPHSPYGSINDVQSEDYEPYRSKSLDDLLIRPNVDHSMKKTACVRYYFASVSGIDRNVGRILAELERLHLDKNTIVVFTSDHGETMCSQGTEDPKNSPYTESTNVPFLVRFPNRIKPSIDTKLMLSSPDIMPTLLGLCNLKGYIPETVEGRDYSSWLVSRSYEVPLRKGALYIKNGDGEKDKDGKVISYFPVARGIKTKDYSYTMTINKMTGKIKSELLYNDKNDPYQMYPLNPNEHQELVLELRLAMKELLKEANDPWYTKRIIDQFIKNE